MRTPLVAALLSLLLTGCVAKGKYLELEDQLAAANASSQETIAAREATIAELEAKLTEMEAELGRVGAALAKKEAKLSQMVNDQGRLNAEVEEMRQALAELEARKAAAEARVQEFRDLVKRFQAMIDAGTLQVKIIDGRMVVVLATDVLFGSGSATLSADGKAALTEVATVLSSFEDRDFQVEGHTDNVPISTERYPSNWHLAAGRAINVVDHLIRSGVSPEHISAASFGDNRPTSSNDTPDGRKQNRRIEIVVVPDLSSMPGYEELQSL